METQSGLLPVILLALVSFGPLNRTTAQTQWISDSLDYQVAPDHLGNVYLSYKKQRSRLAADGTIHWTRAILADSSSADESPRVTAMCVRPDGALVCGAASIVVADNGGRDQEVSVLVIDPDGELIEQFGASRDSLGMYETTFVPNNGIMCDGEGNTFMLFCSNSLPENARELIKFHNGVAQWWIRLPSLYDLEGRHQDILADGNGGCYVSEVGGVNAFDPWFRIFHITADGTVSWAHKYDYTGSGMTALFWDLDRLSDGHFLITGAFSTALMPQRVMFLELDAQGELLSSHLYGPLFSSASMRWQSQVYPDGSILSKDGEGNFLRLDDTWNATAAFRSEHPTEGTIMEDVVWYDIEASGTKSAMLGIQVTTDQLWGTQTYRTLLAQLADGDLSALCHLVPITVQAATLPLGLITVENVDLSSMMSHTISTQFHPYHLEETVPDVFEPYCAGEVGVEEGGMRGGCEISVVNDAFVTSCQAGRVLRLYSHLGDLVRSWPMRGSSTFTGLEELPPGVYLAEVMDASGQRVSTRKVQWTPR